MVLKEERSSKEELLADKQSIERKSKEFIESQQRQMEELNQAKVSIKASSQGLALHCVRHALTQHIEMLE